VGWTRRPEGSMLKSIRVSATAMEHDSVLSSLPLYSDGQHGATPRQVAAGLGKDPKNTAQLLKALWHPGIVGRRPAGRTYRHWMVEKSEVQCLLCRKQFSVQRKSLKLPSHGYNNIYGHRMNCPRSGRPGTPIVPMAIPSSVYDLAANLWSLRN